jgi:hypothetical protein
MSTRDLVPEPKPRDDRREHLQRFQSGFADALSGAEPEDFLDLNHALRTLLNIRAAELLPIPRSADEITIEHVEAQFRAWVEAQCRRYEADADLRRLWTSLGLADERMVRDTTLALAQSVALDYPKMAEWLASVVRHHQKHERPDLSRLLALAMGNAVVRGASKRRQAAGNDDFGSGSRAAKAAPYKDFFLAPFAGEKGQLQQLIQRDIRPQKRPDQPGDAKILELSKLLGEDPETVTEVPASA